MNKLCGHEQYFEYLKQRSLLGSLYRNYILYPRLSAELKGNVLDFGCGIGDFLNFYDNAIGVDINHHNIEHCKCLGLKAVLLDENGQSPFKDGTFSGVVMDNVIEHVPIEFVGSVLKEALRVLCSGGRLLIGVPGLKGYASDDDHKCYYSEYDLVALLRDYGCRKVKSFHMPFRIQWLECKLSQYCIYVLFVKA